MKRAGLGRADRAARRAPEAARTLTLARLISAAAARPKAWPAVLAWSLQLLAGRLAERLAGLAGVGLDLGGGVRGRAAIEEAAERRDRAAGAALGRARCRRSPSPPPNSPLSQSGGSGQLKPMSKWSSSPSLAIAVVNQSTTIFQAATMPSRMPSTSWRPRRSPAALICGLLLVGQLLGREERAEEVADRRQRVADGRADPARTCGDRRQVDAEEIEEALGKRADRLGDRRQRTHDAGGEAADEGGQPVPIFPDQEEGGGDRQDGAPDGRAGGADRARRPPWRRCGRW